MYNKFMKFFPKGISRVIKNFIFFMIPVTSTCYAADSYSESTLLSIHLENQTIKEVFSEIEKNSEYIFFYYQSVVDLDRKVTINANKQTIDVILNKLFESTDIQYIIRDRQISLTKKKVDTASERLSPKQQRNITVRGIIIDTDNNPIPGVNIVIKGTTKGVVTDIDGTYTIVVGSEDAILVFSFVGYTSQERIVGNLRQINVILQEDIMTLEEVVAVGYGTQKKASVVGAITQITTEDLQRTKGTTNLATGLTGLIPGVTVIQSTGQPGAEDPSIYIRGVGTWNQAEPLILVDGIERRMSDIDISEVETISVLKDASATAVFGVKGAEGVILITTKRGKLGKPVISFDTNFSTKTISRMPEKLNSYDQLLYRNEAIEYQLHRGGQENDWAQYTPFRILQYYKQPQANGLQYLFPDVDWPGELLKDFPLSNRVNLNISGGTDFAKYFGAITYTFDDDLIRTNADPTNRGYKAQNSYQRVNIRSNLDLNLTKTTLLSINMGGWIGTRRNSSGDTTDQIFNAFQGASPDQYPVLMPDGITYGYHPQIPGTNPLQRANNFGVSITRNTSLNTDFVLKQELDFLTKGLSARLSFSYDNAFVTTSGISDGGQARNLYINPMAIDILYMDEKGSYIDENGNFNVKEGYRLEDYMEGYLDNQNSNDDYDWTKGTPGYQTEASGAASNVSRRVFYQAQVNYNRTFGPHDVGALALFNREQYAAGSTFPRYREDWVGRVTYGYDNRYLFESNFAYNGSERFGPGYRFGFFPSVAAGWMITEETFMKGIHWMDRLKIRYTIGKIGNDSFGGRRWAYQTNWALGSDRTFFAGDRPVNSPYQQYYEVGIGNPDLRWETAIKQNLGTEIGLFKNRIGLNLDLFTEHRSDIFLVAGNRILPPYFGQDPVDANIGEVEVKGYELELSLKNSFQNGIHAFLNINHTGAIDKILYREDPALLPAYQKQEGYAINQVRTQIDAGYLNNWDDVYSSTGFSSGNTSRMPGEYRIIDFNGDGQLDASDAAPYSYPENRPMHTYGFTVGGSYKGFNLTVQFYGVYNVTRQYGWRVFPFSNQMRTGPVFAAFTDTWTPDNTMAKYRATNLFMQGIQSLGTFPYEDGSYLRLKTAEIGYTLKNTKEFLGVNSVKFYLNGNNLFLWSKTIDDYEGSMASAPTYPLIRRFNLGVNVQF